MSALEYLENERVKLWEKISELQDQIDRKTTDYEREAQQASKKCSEFKNKCESTKNDASRLLAAVEKITGDIQKTDVNALIKEIKSIHDDLLPKKDVIHEQISELESLFNDFAEYSEKIRKLDSICTSADETSTKIEITLKQIAGKKKEIEQLHMEIFGYTGTDPDSGNSLDVTGLKAELEETYFKLKTDFETFSNEKSKKFDETLKEWQTNYSH